MSHVKQQITGLSHATISMKRDCLWLSPEGMEVMFYRRTTAVSHGSHSSTHKKNPLKLFPEGSKFMPQQLESFHDEPVCRRAGKHDGVRTRSQILDASFLACIALGQISAVCQRHTVHFQRDQCPTLSERLAESSGN